MKGSSASKTNLSKIVRYYMCTSVCNSILIPAADGKICSVMPDLPRKLLFCMDVSGNPSRTWNKSIKACILSVFNSFNLKWSMKLVSFSVCFTFWSDADAHYCIWISLNAILCHNRHNVMAHLHCRRRIRVPTRIRIPNLMATLYYSEHVHIAQTRTQIPTPYFCVRYESKSIPESVAM